MDGCECKNQPHYIIYIVNIEQKWNLDFCSRSDSSSGNNLTVNLKADNQRKFQQGSAAGKQQGRNGSVDRCVSQKNKKVQQYQNNWQLWQLAHLFFPHAYLPKPFNLKSSNYNVYLFDLLILCYLMLYDLWHLSISASKKKKFKIVTAKATQKQQITFFF